jgi:hypothetical protein
MAAFWCISSTARPPGSLPPADMDVAFVTSKSRGRRSLKASKTTIICAVRRHCVLWAPITPNKVDLKESLCVQFSWKMQCLLSPHQPLGTGEIASYSQSRDPVCRFYLSSLCRYTGAPLFLTSLALSLQRSRCAAALRREAMIADPGLTGDHKYG